MFGTQRLPDSAFGGIGGGFGQMSRTEQIPAQFIGGPVVLFQQALA